MLSFWFPTFSDMILFVWKISLLGHIDGESADNPEQTLVSSVSIREEGVGYVVSSNINLTIAKLPCLQPPPPPSWGVKAAVHGLLLNGYTTANSLKVTAILNFSTCQLITEGNEKRTAGVRLTWIAFRIVLRLQPTSKLSPGYGYVGGKSARTPGELARKLCTRAM